MANMLHNTESKVVHFVVRASNIRQLLADVFCTILQGAVRFYDGHCRFWVVSSIEQGFPSASLHLL